ncbi:MAG: VWA domain-containing protein [Alphaproteobacteria bacterium]|nr:MAG: VWA domain-containing protein [Alphaproteobacteria bacterium]
MFLKLFGSIRNNGVPVTLREYLDLLEGLSKGLCSSNKIEDFYNFSKLCLVKDEKNYDKFDKAFNSFYEENKNIINQVEKKIPESWVLNELKKIFSNKEKDKVSNDKDWKDILKEFEKRLKEQKKRHQGGNKWIGTGGTSMFGNSGYNPKGVRVGGKSTNRSAVKVWEKRIYQNLDDQVTINTRNIKMALRRLRKLTREGLQDEFDLDNTITATAKNAGLLDVKYRSEKKNSVRVLLLIDIGGSMDDHAKSCEQVFSAAKSEFKSLDYFYFHNCVYENIWKNNNRRHSEYLETENLLRIYSKNTKLIFIGDALMSPYEITYPGGSVEHWNEKPGVFYINKLVNYFDKVVWLNPEQRQNWQYSQSTMILRDLVKKNMFQMNLKGIESAMKNLI